MLWTAALLHELLEENIIICCWELQILIIAVVRRFKAYITNYLGHEIV